MIAISVKNLVKQFKIRQRSPGIFSALSSFVKSKEKTVFAVNDISLEIKQGELIGFIGPNGAGKTTTLKCLSGLLYPTSGKINVLGCIPFERKSAYLKNISLVMGQKNQLIWDLAPIETYRLNKAIYDITQTDFEKNLKELSELLDVKGMLNTPVRQLSLGQRMKMELIASLLHNPKILFLDEPTIGLDVVMQDKIRDFFSKYNEKYNSTILLTSHYMTDVKKLCRRVIIIDSGELIYDGKLQDLVEKYSDYKVITATLASKINREKLSKFGKIKSLDGQKVTLFIPRKSVNYTASKMLKDLKVEDLNIEEPEIEEIIRLVFKRNK
jgi:ABC-2 type transport system ATP-binding protein